MQQVTVQAASSLRHRQITHEHRPPYATIVDHTGLSTKQHLYDIITEFPSKNPRVERRPPSLSRSLTDTETQIVDVILELLNKHGLTSYQPLNLLERLGGIIEIGQRPAKRTTQWEV